MNQPPAFRIPLSVPHLSGSEWGFLQEQDLTSLLLLTGLVERELCQATGADFALATPSGTAALELALRILHIGPGDLVVCPTLTFSATANAITATGATPVFVGSEPTTWGLDPDALETALKTLPKRPEAIIVVDVYGMPACWTALKAVADHHEIPLVADAAESLGSQLNGLACGTMGVLNAISFNQNKIITGYSGGVLLTNEPLLEAKARIIANQGRQTEPPFEQVVAGGNYRMNPLSAGYLRSQLPTLPDRVTQRRAIFAQYYNTLHQWPGLHFQPEPAGAISNRWLTALTIDPTQTGVSHDEVADALRKSGIETRPVFLPLHRQRAFQGCLFCGSSLADELAQTGICLPSGSGLPKAAIREVIEVFKTQLGCH